MTCFCFYLSSNILKDENFRIFEFNNGLCYIKSCFICIVDCKTTPSFARSAKIKVFERVLARGHEMVNEARKESPALFFSLIYCKL